jgi:hypothetical protein
MPRAAFLFVFVGLFATAWSNDPGLASVKTRPGRSTPSRGEVPTPTESLPDVARPLAEREPQCTWVIVNRRIHSRVR